MSRLFFNPNMVWTANARGQMTTEAQQFLRGLTTGPVAMSSYTVASVPTAAANEACIIFVSNEAGGATLAFSDGTNWRRVQDRAIIS